MKSALSPVEDLVRGVFQCVKYRAVVEAFLVSRALPQRARVLLAVEVALPEEVVLLKDLLGIDVVGVDLR